MFYDRRNQSPEYYGTYTSFTGHTGSNSDDQHVIRLYGTRVANVVYVCIILLFITTSFYKRNESYREN